MYIFSYAFNKHKTCIYPKMNETLKKIDTETGPLFKFVSFKPFIQRSRFCVNFDFC